MEYKANISFFTILGIKYYISLTITVKGIRTINYMIIRVSVITHSVESLAQLHAAKQGKNIVKSFVLFHLSLLCHCLSSQLVARSMSFLRGAAAWANFKPRGSESATAKSTPQ